MGLCYLGWTNEKQVKNERAKTYTSHWGKHVCMYECENNIGFLRRVIKICLAQLHHACTLSPTTVHSLNLTGVALHCPSPFFLYFLLIYLKFYLWTCLSSHHSPCPQLHYFFSFIEYNTISVLVKLRYTFCLGWHVYYFRIKYFILRFFYSHFNISLIVRSKNDKIQFILCNSIWN